MRTLSPKLGISVLATYLILTSSLHAAEPDPLKGRAYRGGMQRSGFFNVDGVVALEGVRWKFPTDAAVKSSPVVVEGTAYFGSNDTHIYAVDVKTGKQQWKVKTKGKVTGSAAVLGGIVYIASEAGRLYALDAATGEQAWTAALPGGKPAGSPAITHGMVIIGVGNGGGSESLDMSNGPLLAFDIKTGRPAKKFRSGPQGYGSVAIWGDTMVYGSQGYVHGMDIESGKLLWRGQFGGQGRDFVTPAVANGRAHGINTTGGGVVTVHATLGTPMWRSSTLPGQLPLTNSGEPGYEIFGAPAVAHDRVYVGSNDGKLHTFGAIRGDRGWTFATGGPVQSAPAVAGRTVYFGSHDAHLYAVDAVTGKLVGKVKLGGRIVSSPWPAGDTVYVGCDDGALYAVKGEVKPPILGTLSGGPVQMPAQDRRSNLIRQVLPPLPSSTPANPVAALKSPSGTMAIVDASPQNLKALVAAADKLKAYTDGGGWLMLWGLTPQGLGDFNRLVGVKHMIRPFTAEEVDTSADGTLCGIAREDVYMESGKRAPGNPFISAPLRSDDAWTYVVDTGDIGPWCKLPGPEFWKKEPGRLTPGSDHFPRNMVNNTSWHWRFGLTILVSRGEPIAWPVGLPPNQKIDGFSIAAGQTFWPITKLRLTFDDGGKPIDLTLKETSGRQDFTFPVRTAKKLTVEILKIAPKGGKRTTSVSNIWIQTARPAEFQRKVKPLLNIGVLVKYPMGKGGIILNQMNVPETEANPINAAKKQRILQALLMTFRKQ
jgi:outer membrane protein assembly factor BamB